MNCLYISQKLKKIEILMAQFELIRDNKKPDLNYLKKLAQKIDNGIKSIKIEMDLEIDPYISAIEECQHFYDEIGLEVNLKKDFHTNQLIIPDNEEKKFAVDRGLNIPFIFPGNLKIKDVIDKINDIIVKEQKFGSSKVRIKYFDIRKIYSNPSRFGSKSYFVYLDSYNPSGSAFPKSPPRILKEKIEKTKTLPVKIDAFNLCEYLLFKTYSCLHINNGDEYEDAFVSEPFQKNYSILVNWRKEFFEIFKLIDDTNMNYFARIAAYPKEQK